MSYDPALLDALARVYAEAAVRELVKKIATQGIGGRASQKGVEAGETIQHDKEARKAARP